MGQKEEFSTIRHHMISDGTTNRLVVPRIITFDNCYHVYHFGAVNMPDGKELYIPMYLDSDCKKQKPGRPSILFNKSNSSIRYPFSISSINQDIIKNYVRDYPTINKLPNHKNSFIHPDILIKERQNQIKARRKRETLRNVQQVTDSVQAGLNNLFGFFSNSPTEGGGD